MPVIIVALFYGVIAGLWLLLIGYAQLLCSVIPSVGKQCYGEQLDVWMLPFFAAPFGGYALIRLISIAIASSRP